MKQHLAILLWAISPDAPHLCATPFIHAAAAAAMDVEVEVYFASKSVLLLAPGIAAHLFAGSNRHFSVYQHMRQASKFGARFIACSDAIEAHGVDRNNLIPEFSGFSGAAAFVARALHNDWTVLTY